jgi:hypothetical protein
MSEETLKGCVKGGRRDVRREVGETGGGKNERRVKGICRTDVGKEYE